MQKLTDRQREVLNFIIDFKDEHGRIPSYREIAKADGVTPHAIAGHILALTKKGYIEKPMGKVRAIKVIRKTVVIANRRIEVGIPGTNIVKVK